MPMSASQRDDNDSANKPATPMLPATPQELHIMTLVLKGMKLKHLPNGKRGDFQSKGGAQVRIHNVRIVRFHPRPRPPKTHRNQTARSGPEAGPWSLWMHPKLQGVFERKVHCPLPPWTEALSLANAFFEQEHMALPIFHPPAFIALLGQQYSGESEKNPAWWTAFNAVLAISHRRRVEQGMSTDKELMWSYAANALDTVLDILLRATQLMSVQALLTLAWFFLGTPNPQPSFMLVANALLPELPRKGHKNQRVLAGVFPRQRIEPTHSRPPAQDFGGFDVGLPDPQL
ncbi:putative fungal specific transcription factor [Colletotrichum sublineola]|uniref:Putative fungal specific transcription factor n=1 Tax=Colletotrichum sublineola TaxID=1173701 RepID=A0A066XY88_COLSU|nr:putative fungal specific transcription factor [Colletotrichum sublineola]